jgi:23S rRNA (cytidine1920-2'-O)/16S rRNA (cytidine1409-2'-O)-methyltransferase
MDAPVAVKEDPAPFVSRGGLKLQKALEVFSLPVSERIFLDVGASTGGFTQCLLNHGAQKVYAVDVGYGQLAWELRQDPRVVVLERTNIRHLCPEHLMDPPQGAVVDVSFISLKWVMPVLKTLLTSDSHGAALIKPQFEAGRGQVGKRGVVRDPKQHGAILLDVLTAMETAGFRILGLTHSPVTGPEGNIEFLCHFYHGPPHKHHPPEGLEARGSRIEAVVSEAHRELKSR